MKGIQIPCIAMLVIGTCLGQAFPSIPSSQYAAVKQLLGLTDEQRAKLKILEDAVSLAPTIAQAQSLQLLPGGDFIPARRVGL